MMTRTTRTIYNGRRVQSQLDGMGRGESELPHRNRKLKTPPKRGLPDEKAGSGSKVPLAATRDETHQTETREHHRIGFGFGNRSKDREILR
jgi:hypothetical protein